MNFFLFVLTWSTSIVSITTAVSQVTSTDSTKIVNTFPLAQLPAACVARLPTNQSQILLNS